MEQIRRGDSREAIQLVVILLVFSGLFGTAGVMISGVPVASMVCVVILVSCLLVGILSDVNDKKLTLLFIIAFIIKCSLLVYQAKYKNLPMGGVDWGIFL